jgi:uncharacterized membrane protein
MDSVLKFLGIQTQEYNDYEIQFLQPIPWWILVILAIIIGILIFFSARNVKGKISGSLRAFLFTLRILAFLLLLVALLQPNLGLMKKRFIKPIIAVLVDTSSSMTIKDMAEGQPRIEAVKKVFNTLKEEGKLDKLAKDHEVHSFQFSDILSPIELANFQNLEARGSKTQLIYALNQLHKDFSNQALEAIFVFSDGIDNVVSSPQALENRKIPIYTFGVGDPQKLIDVQIANLVTDEFAFLDKEVEIDVTVRGMGLKGKSVPITLTQNGAPLAIQSVEFPRDSHETMLKLSFTPRETGTFDYLVSIPIQAGEVVTDNNKKHFTLQVVRNKLRVLFVSGNPRWEYRFLRRALKKDPNVELVSFMILRSAFDIVDVPNDQLSLIPFPVHRLFTEDLPKFDLLIFDNFDYRPYFSPIYLENIRQFVEQQGKAFIMIGGEHSFNNGSYQFTPLERIIPVDINRMSSASQQPYTQSQQGGVPTIYKDTFRIKLTEEGYTHPITRLLEDIEQNKKLWSEIPKSWGSNSVLKSKPGAITLGVHPTRKTEQGIAMPVLIVQQIGEGRVMAMTSGSTWRWSFENIGKGGSDQYYLQFWRQAVRWLTKAPELRLVKLKTNKKDYDRGEDVNIEVTVLNESYQPLNEAELRLTLQKTDGTTQELSLFRSESTDGLFQTMTRPDQPGIYRLKVSAKYDGKLLGEDQQIVEVSTSDLELENPGLNSNFLKTLSDLTSGAYSHISSENEVKARFDLKLPMKVETTEVNNVDLWDNPLSFALIFLLLCGEWFVRKRAGMK